MKIEMQSDRGGGLEQSMPLGWYQKIQITLLSDSKNEAPLPPQCI